MAKANSAKYLRTALLAVGLVMPTGTLVAQEAVKHLNPVIAKLAADKPFIGFQTTDLSFQNARTLARADGFCRAASVHGRHDRQGRHSQEGQRPAQRGNIRPLSSVWPGTGAVVR